MVDNQHKKISGYRDLTEQEIACINAVKQIASSTGELIATLRQMPELDQRWVSIAETHLQQGFMAATRSIAKPTTF